MIKNLLRYTVASSRKYHNILHWNDPGMAKRIRQKAEECIPLIMDYFDAQTGFQKNQLDPNLPQKTYESLQEAVQIIAFYEALLFEYKMITLKNSPKPKKGHNLRVLK